MLNGKFFTGLPPKMMERNNAGSQNRLESHLFWPDDSKTTSANETRLRRRTSFQAESPSSRDASFQRQTSWSGGVEQGVNTRQRFHKEFANSSIQFYDNIQEEETDSQRQAIRKPLIRKTLKQDIAMKPTAMNMKLPNNDVAQEEYAAIKKNQAFSSKIRFYDYADNNDRQNNKLRPKMDMNDKKDVERNTKNSPKLQVKGIVRNIHVLDEQRNNNERSQVKSSEGMQYDQESYGVEERPTRIIRNEVHEEQRNSRGHGNDGRFNGRNDGYKRHESPVRNHRIEMDYTYDDETHNDLYETPNQYVNERRSVSRAQSVPKRILKNPIRNERRDFDELRGSYNDLQHVEHGVRNMRIRNSPKKHVTYGDEIYEYEAHNGNYQHHHHSDDNTDYREQQRMRAEESHLEESTTHNSRNQTKSTQRTTTGNNNQRSQQSRPNIPDYETYEERCSNDHIEGSNALKKSLSFNKSNNNKNNNNNSFKANNLRQEQQRRITPKISTSSSMASPTPSTQLSSSETMDAQKHLRSSLCFSGGEIVANNRAEAGSGTPTSEAGSRRTARSAATSRRICVGLPD